MPATHRSYIVKIIDYGSHTEYSHYYVHMQNKYENADAELNADANGLPVLVLLARTSWIPIYPIMLCLSLSLFLYL